jgi:FkbM family methyltransferase
VVVEVLNLEYQGNKFSFLRTKQAPAVINEIFNDNYKVLANKIEFKEGDIILDVGANEGMFSILMSKMFPQTKIISLEPVPDTFHILLENIKINEVTNVMAYNVGVGGSNDRKATLSVSKDFSGGSTKWCTHNPDHHNKIEVGLISLDRCFKLYGIKRCKLLKMDIEGMEYEALYQSNVLKKVENFTAEFHTNRRLDFESRRVDGLINWVAKQTKILHIEICGMAE